MAWPHSVKISSKDNFNVKYFDQILLPFNNINLNKIYLQLEAFQF